MAIKDRILKWTFIIYLVVGEKDTSSPSKNLLLELNEKQFDPTSNTKWKKFDPPDFLATFLKIVANNVQYTKDHVIFFILRTLWRD